jgi:DNA-binding beta-propeller fold protein YncE
MKIPRRDRVFTPAVSALLLTLVFGTALMPALHAAQLVLVAGGSAAAPAAQLREPFGVEFNSAGDAFVIEMAKGNRLLRLDSKTGALAHVAGQSVPGDSGDDGPALRAQFNGPHNLAVHPDGRVFIADTWNGRIRVYDPATGLVSTQPGYGVPAAQARAHGPYCLALNPAGTHLYIADLRRVHALELATGKLAVIAGNGEKGIPADGALATAAPLVDPRAVAVDRHGHVYILERNGHALRVVTPDGRIRTVVNASGKKGATGDGGDARLATLNGPKHLCLDRDDSILIADAENNLIRRYVPATGKILRVAGTGKKGAAGLDGPPEAAELARPHGITVHRDGTLYITDSYNDRILKIVP